MVFATIVALPSNLNGAQAEPFHWEMSPVADAIQMSSASVFAGALAELVIRFPPRVLTDARVQHRRAEAAVLQEPAQAARAGRGRGDRPGPGQLRRLHRPGGEPGLVRALGDGVERERPLFRAAADRLGVAPGQLLDRAGGEEGGGV